MEHNPGNHIIKQKEMTKMMNPVVTTIAFYVMLAMIFWTTIILLAIYFIKKLIKRGKK
jgi:flagellar biogenesis protein FliO